MCEVNLIQMPKFLLAVLLLGGLLNAQTTMQGGAPVSYTSASQLNGVLSQLQQTAQNIQGDLSKLRIDKWKADGNTKRQTQENVASIQRNLQSAVPEIIGTLRNAPESLPETFRLYRNLDALYDVFSNVTESAGAFGPKDDFKALDTDLGALESSRHAVADRMDSLATAKENELNQLRTAVRAAQASPPPPPKKVIVDDTEPPKKKATRKKTTKKPATEPTSGGTQPPPK